MKNPKTVSMLVGLGLMLGLANGYTQGHPGNNHGDRNIFINNTRQDVDGLHIEYNTIAFLNVIQNPATFADVQEDVEGQLTLNSGTVAAGGSVQIIAYNSALVDVGNIRKWWWTDGSGNLVGAKHRACTNPDCTSP